jgi:hypothetical protein
MKRSPFVAASARAYAQEDLTKRGVAMNYKACCIVMLAICLSGLVGCSSVRPVINTSPVIAVVAISGTPQAHEVNGAFGSPMVAMVTDNGLPAAGVVVTFTAPTTGAGGNFANSGATTTATTNASGLATTALFTADGTAGTYAVTALASGATTPAVFTLTNTIGAPATIQPTSGMTQSTAISTAFSKFVVTVLDRGGNPVSNAVVTFTASTSSSGASGTFTSNGTNTETDTTNTSGIATSSVFTANGTSGSYTLNVAVGTVSVNITLTNSAAPASVAATGSTTQGTAINTPFAPLSVLVLDSSTPPNPVNGASVTFAVQPASNGASGTFNGGTATETDTTNTQGIATASTFTANGITGSYTVTATVNGLTPITFNLANQVLSNTYVFYLSGVVSGSYYALVGAVQIDGSGNVLGGVQDFNAPGLSIISPQPNGDTIMASATTPPALAVDATGQGTLTLTTNNSSLGVAGVETLGVQFVNTNHALIIGFDGTATSSGSMDLQTATSLPTAGTPSYAFTLSGVDATPDPIGFGGVFTITPGTTTTFSGKFDTNDAAASPPVALGVALSGTFAAAGAFGRGTVSGFTNGATSQPVALNYYIVGSEVMRLVDVDSTATLGGAGVNDSAVGSAFGQGSTGLTLGTSVFGINGTSINTSLTGDGYAAAGMFSTTGSSFSGVADIDELAAGLVASGVSISGTVSLPGTPNGYGSLTIAPGVLGDLSVLGVYLTDPNLNLMDPNNTTTGNAAGGGLIADMDSIPADNAVLSGGTGFLIPQSDTSAASFTGNTSPYAFGAQVIDADEEFDFVGLGAFTTGVLNGVGLLSDPLNDLTGDSTTNSGVGFSVTPAADSSHLGRYTEPLGITITGVSPSPALDAVMYQASGDELLWLNEDVSSVFFGSMQVQGSLAGLPTSAERKPGAKTKAKRKPRQ